MKLNPEFRRDAYHNYMIFNQSEEVSKTSDKNAYELQMVRQNKLIGLLELQITIINSQVLYSYEITGRQTLSNILEIKKVDQDGCILLFNSLLQAINTCDEYLLNYNHLVLQPEYIYYNWATKSYEFLYHVEYQRNLMEQINSLAEYLMDMINYTDERGVLIVYGIYHESKKKESTISSIMRFLGEEKELKTAKPTTYNKLVDNKLVDNKVIGDKEAAEEVIEDKILEDKDVNNRAVNSESQSAVTNKKRIQLVQRPKVEERQEREEVVYQYPKTSYIIVVALAVLTTMVSGVGIVSSVGLQKTGVIFLMGTSITLYVASKVFDKEKKIEKIITRVEYVVPDDDFNNDKLKTMKLDKDELSKDELSKEKINQVELNQVEINQIELNHVGIKRNDLNYMELGKEEMNRGWLNQEGMSQEDTNQHVQQIDYQNQQPEEFEEVTQLLSIVINDTETRQVQAECILLPEVEEKYETMYIKDVPYLIGKIKEGVDIIINEASISRIHAKITCEDNTYYLTDLGSLNGSYVNDLMLQPYSKAQLVDGDQVRFANIGYKFTRNNA